MQRVCVTLNADVTQRNLVVTLSTSDGTAQGSFIVHSCKEHGFKTQVSLLLIVLQLLTVIMRHSIVN